MILKELEKLLLEFDLKYKKKSVSPRTGKTLLHRSGRGMDFKESRVYNYGDDIRFIDWNVSSRMNELYVKVFHEETDRQINLFIDVSKSMDFKASSERTKFFIAFQILAFFTLLGVQSGDRINLLPYSDKLHSIKNNIKSKAQAYKFLKDLYSYSCIDSTDHSIPFSYLKNRAKKNSISYILSDFANLNNLDTFKSVLSLHEVYAIRVFDPIEELSNQDLLKNFFIRNMESGKSGNLSSSFNLDGNKLDQFFRNNLLNIRTNSNLSKELIRFLLK